MKVSPWDSFTEVWQDFQKHMKESDRQAVPGAVFLGEGGKVACDHACSRLLPYGISRAVALLVFKWSILQYKHNLKLPV